jgi:protein gp37
MSDVFHANFTLQQIRSVFDVMNEASWHQFQVLTKRPERARRLADHLPWSPNIWIGVSVESMTVARRVEALRGISQAAIRFISAEPLLGPLDDLDLSGIDWVIGGGESGPLNRTCKAEWALGLRDRCEDSGIAFFWKQWGGKTAKSGGRVLDGREYSAYPIELGAP